MIDETTTIRQAHRLIVATRLLRDLGVEPTEEMLQLVTLQLEEYHTVASWHHDSRQAWVLARMSEILPQPEGST